MVCAKPCGPVSQPGALVQARQRHSPPSRFKLSTISRWVSPREMKVTLSGLPSRANCIKTLLQFVRIYRVMIM